MTTDAYDYARQIATELETLALSEDDATSHDAGTHWLNYDVLDVWAEVRWRQDRSDVHAVTALRTTGGPHCEVTWDGNRDDILAVRVWWSSDESTVRVKCSTVAEAMSLVWDNAHTALGGPTD